MTTPATAYPSPAPTSSNRAGSWLNRWRVARELCVRDLSLEAWTESARDELSRLRQETEQLEARLEADIAEARAQEGAHVLDLLRKDLFPLFDDLQQRGEATGIDVLVTQVKAARREAEDLMSAEKPVPMDVDSFREALRTFAEQTETAYGVTCAFNEVGDGSAGPLITQSAGQMLRCVKEAVSNAARHGRATSIRILLANVKDHCSLTVSDDGVGIAEEANRSGGAGLHTMEYRFRSVGGALKVDSNRSDGTVVGGLMKQDPEGEPG